MSVFNDDGSIDCTIPCDYCGEKPAYWFRGTSVAICHRQKCYERCVANWEEHCAQGTPDSAIEDENNEW